MRFSLVVLRILPCTLEAGNYRPTRRRYNPLNGKRVDDIVLGYGGRIFIGQPASEAILQTYTHHAFTVLHMNSSHVEAITFGRVP